MQKATDARETGPYERHSRTSEIRRNYLPDYTKWFTTRVRKVVFLRLDDLSMDLVRPPSVVPNRADGQLDIHIFGAGKGLTTVEGLDCSQFIEILFHERGELAEVLATSFTGDLETPGVFKSLLGSFDSGVDVDGCTFSYASESLPVCYLRTVLSERINVSSGVAGSLGLIILRKNEQSELTVVVKDLLKGVAFGSTRELSIDENTSGEADLALEGLGREFVVEGS